MPIFLTQFKTDFFCLGIIGAIGLVLAVFAIAGAIAA